MPRYAMLLIDLVAISVLVFGLYFPRHRRKDLVVSYLAMNVGVFAVADALASTGIDAGLGLGLFGVLSIIRLRSSELDQQEIAYYFCSLALGLLGGLTVEANWLTPLLMVVLLVALFVGDHPRLYKSYRTKAITLDRAYADETDLEAALVSRLGGTIHRMKVRRVDFVNDTTNVEVRYAIEQKRLAKSFDAQSTTS